MIGVVCKTSERETVREFFELFKTPWRFYDGNGSCTVVVTTVDPPGAVDAALQIMFSSAPTALDDTEGLRAFPAASDHVIGEDGSPVPIYGKLSRFLGPGHPLVFNRTESEVLGVTFPKEDRTLIRVGYDLFDEVGALLSEGQPARNSMFPTLEAHISLLRQWMVSAGIPVVEIPPIPAGHRFITCLTHDVDFVSIRQHKLDHTFWGFVRRGLWGSLAERLHGDGSAARLSTNWRAVFSLPLVYLGWARDFWDQFDRYAELEQGLGSTFFLIPFKDRPGEYSAGRYAYRRAARYDIGDVREQVERLVDQKHEIGVHGIDAWCSAEKGERERRRISEASGQQQCGIRMHWLYFERESPTLLEQAGFDYDSSVGYNDAVGFRAGTLQVYRPPGATQLLELPLHLQDTALFYPRRLALDEQAAWTLCQELINAAINYGGVLTVLWHLRSLAPERLWGEFYIRLVQELKRSGAWFGTGRQVVQWYRTRRAVVFEECAVNKDRVTLRLRQDGFESDPPLLLRVHQPARAGLGQAGSRPGYFDTVWAGEPTMEIPLH